MNWKYFFEKNNFEKIEITLIFVVGVIVDKLMVMIVVLVELVVKEIIAIVLEL